MARWMAFMTVLSTAVSFEWFRRSATWRSASAMTMSRKEDQEKFLKSLDLVLWGFYRASYLFLRGLFFKCHFLSVYGGSVISRWIYCRVIGLLSVFAEKTLRLTDLADDVERAGTSYESISAFSIVLMASSKLCLVVGGAVLGRESSVMKWVHKRKEKILQCITAARNNRERMKMTKLWFRLKNIERLKLIAKRTDDLGDWWSG